MRLGDRRFVALLLFAAVPPVVELAILVALGFKNAEGLSAQVTAVWPYDAYHDLRWLLIYHNSWPDFFGESAAALGIRALLSAALAAMAWPKEVPRPTFRWLLRRNLLIAVLVGVIVMPLAAISVAASVVALSWFLIASLVPLLLLSPFLQRAGVVAGWWQGLPSASLVGWTLLNFAAITVGGALIWITPRWWALPVAAAVGVSNGLLWRESIRTAVLPCRVRWLRFPVAPVAIVLAVSIPIVVRMVATAVPGPPENWQPPILSQQLSEHVKHAVIVVDGHESVYDGSPTADPMVERFSYVGLDTQERPRPYDPDDTHRSLESTAELMAAHVDSLHRRTGRPIAIIGRSEGAMAARLYLERWPDSPVDTLLMFSPLIRPGRGYYPPPEEQTGWGVVTGWQLRALFGLSNIFSEHPNTPDDPFVRSLMANAPFYRNRTMCPVPGVRMIAFLPTITAAEAPPGEYTKIPVFQAPAFHGGLIGRQLVQVRIVDILAGESLDQPRPEYPVLQRLAASWQAPPLKVSVNPAWDKIREPDPAFTGKVCLPR